MVYIPFTDIPWGCLVIKKNILLFRGTFDPIHIGHINLVKDAIDLINVDFKRLGMFNELWILPTFIRNRFKSKKKLTDSLHRVRMLHLAFANSGIPAQRLRICTFELDTRNKAGIYKTIKALCKCYPTYTFSVLMGIDQAIQIRSFRYSRNFVREVKCVVNARYGITSATDHEQLRWFVKKPHVFLGVPTTNRNIFSGKIRRVLSNFSVEDVIKSKRLHIDLVPEVEEYIKDNNLYFNTYYGD